MTDLTLSNVTAVRGRRTVLDAIDACFRGGRLTVVIGPNGAGKSTLLEVAAGLLAPEQGTVLLDDAPLSGLTRLALARRRAYLPQSPTIAWSISVEQVVALGLSPHLPAFGRPSADWQSRIDDALARYDLLDLRDRAATALSGGELARVMLARATVGAPEVLIVDEPTTGLDPRHALYAGRQLRALAAAGRTVAVALHDLDLALRIADDAIAVKHGRVVAAGSVATVFTPDVLSGLYDVAVQVRRDAAGATLRFVD